MDSLRPESRDRFLCVFEIIIAIAECVSRLLVGLKVRHSQVSMIRGVLEGVAFGLRDSFELMREAGLAGVEQVRITDSGARSPLWRQIMADIFGVELVSVNAEESAAYGAALLAAVGSGVWPDVPTASRQLIQITGSTEPQSEHTAVYDQQYTIYRTLYPALQETFHTLSA